MIFSTSTGETEISKAKDEPYFKKSGDLISRKAVLQATVEKNSIWNKITDSRGKNLEEIIKELPTIPQTDISWIKEEICKIAMMCDDKDKQQLDILVQLLSLISSINEKGLDKQVIPQTAEPQTAIIRCKDCRFYHKKWDGTETNHYEDYWCEWVEPDEDDFCSLAESKHISGKEKE